MSGIALCLCGIDMVEHYGVRHHFSPSGTKHRCEEILPNGYMCALPRFHVEDGLPHGPILGEAYIP